MERYHADKAVASRVINIFSDNAISRFRDILKGRLKQISMEKLLLKQSESEAESNGAQSQKIEKRRIPIKTVT